MALPKNMTELLEELHRLCDNTTETRAEDDKELLEIALKEVRRLYDHVTSSFDHLRSHALALMGGEVAILTFLFSSKSSTNNSFFHKSVPVYGIVFYGIGIALLTCAFLIFLHVISSVRWMHPPDEKDVANVTDRFNHSTVKFLSHLIGEYIESINHCISVLNVKAKWFMRAVYALSVGIFIIVMLKFGGSIIKI
jgi:hypothetical protein